MKKKEEHCCCGNECGCNEECNCENNENSCCEHDSETEDLLTKRIKTLEDTVLRTQAELQNYRKRKDEETARIIKYAEEDIIVGFLPILDNFERAIMMDKTENETNNKFLEGFRMVYNQTKALLDKFEVKEIECLGKEFDPSFAQAISTRKDENSAEGTVLEVYQKGYMFKDKVIRLAMVIVNQ